MLHVEIGEPMSRIAEWRERRGLSQAELAARIGMTQPNLQRYESGNQRLTVDLMRRLADALDVSSLELLPIALSADLRTDAIEADMPTAGPIASAMASKGLKPFKMLTGAVERLGIQAGDMVVVDCSLTEPAPNSVVVAAVTELLPDSSEASQPHVIVRQYIVPGMLVTNRSTRNVVIDIGDSAIAVEIIGTVIRDPK